MAEHQLRGRKKFSNAVLEETRSFLEAFANDDRLLEVMKNVIFDDPGPRYMGITLPPREKALSKILSGFTEIDESFTVLLDIPFYIKRFPSKNTGISKTRFLNYHVVNYFNEMYILRERLVTYQKVITRVYKNDQRLAEMGNQIKNLEMLLSGLDGIVVTRGKHVHQKRYSDDDFARLNFFEITSDESDLLNVILGKLYPLALQEYRKKWIKIITDNNSSIEKLLDKYFEILYGVVFDENGKFVDPNSA